MALSEVEELEMLRLRKRKAMAGAVSPVQPDQPASEPVPASPAPVQPAGTPTLGQPIQEDMPNSPYMLNKFKQGVAGLVDTGPLIGDLASYPLRRGLYETGLAPNKPDVLPMTSAVDQATKNTLGYDPRTPIPRDEWGKPKLVSEALGNMSELAGMSLLPSGAVVAASETPIRAALKEGAGVVLSGEGMTMGNHFAPEGYEGVGEFAGSLTGPMIAQKAIDAAMGGNNWITRKANNLGIVGAGDYLKAQGLEAAGFKDAAERARQKSLELRKQEATARAAQELGPQLRAPQVIQNIQDVGDISRLIPGFAENLTLGRVTDAPGIQSLERHFGSTEDSIGIARQRSEGLKTAISNQTERRFPQAMDISETTPISGLQRAAQAKVESLDAGLKRIEDQERNLAQKYQRGDQEALGVQAQDVRSRLMKETKAAADARYALVSAAAEKAGVKVDVSDIRDLATQINKDAGNVFQDQPGVIGEILRNYKSQGDKGIPPMREVPGGGRMRLPTSVAERKDPIVSMDEFRSLVRRTNEDIGSYGAQAHNGVPGAADKQRQLMMVKNVLEAKLTEMEGPAYGEVGKLLKDANSFYKDKYVSRFKQGVGGEMGATGRFGATSSNENAKIFSNLVMKPNDPSGMREYLAMTAGDKEGMSALENGIMDIMARKVTNADGVISKTALSNFLRDNKQSLDLVPGIRSKIESVEGATSALTSNRENLIAARREYTNSTLRKVAGSDNPDAVVATAMKSPRVMKELISNAVTPDEKRSVARAIVDKVSGQPNPLEFMDKNRAILEQALGRRQLSYLNTILKAQEIAGRVEEPGFVAFQKLKDPLAEKVGTSIPQVVSEQKNISQHFASPATALARVGVRFWNVLRNDQRETIMKDAIFNPEFAQSLATYMEKGTPEAKKELNVHLIPYGIRAGATVTQLVVPGNAQ